MNRTFLLPLTTRRTRKTRKFSAFHTALELLRFFRVIRVLRVICGLLTLATAVIASPVKIELPPETAALKKAPGSELVTAQCIVCHSVEYISTQPPLPRTYWLGAVTKMQQKFGAPVAPGDVEAIVDYLARNYGADPAAAK